MYTILVDGAVEYPILVKHGEDVRQDERITQLLGTIDVALKRDVESKKRNLRIRTFQVGFVTVFLLRFFICLPINQMNCNTALLIKLGDPVDNIVWNFSVADRYTHFKSLLRNSFRIPFVIVQVK